MRDWRMKRKGARKRRDEKTVVQKKMVRNKTSIFFSEKTIKIFSRVLFEILYVLKEVNIDEVVKSRRLYPEPSLPRACRGEG